MSAHVLCIGWHCKLHQQRKRGERESCIIKSPLKYFPWLFFLFKLPQDGLNSVKLAGSSVTQFIVLIFAFWQPSVIPDVIFPTTWKNSYKNLKGGRETVFLHLVLLKAMMMLHRQCFCAAGAKTDWRHAQEETAPR